MSSDMPSAFGSTVEHFGSPGKVVFTAYDAVIHTILKKWAVSATFGTTGGHHKVMDVAKRPALPSQ